MPTDDERREYPHMSEDDWARLEEFRAAKERGEYPFLPADGPPGFEEQVLALLREQTELLREIRDALTGRTPKAR